MSNAIVPMVELTTGTVKSAAPLPFPIAPLSPPEISTSHAPGG